MNRADLLNIYCTELAEVMEMNDLDGMEEALDAVIHELYASLKLFGKRPAYALPEGFDMEDFRRHYNYTLHHI